MNILYLGDIYADPGIEVVGKVLPSLKKTEGVDLAIAQSENVTDGRGMSISDMKTLQGFGVDAFTGGNWNVYKPETLAESYPVTRPANYPDRRPGEGFRYINTSGGNVLIISLLGKIVGRDSDQPMLNPLRVASKILDSEKTTPKVATIVNFHGDYSSEKKIIGYYLDGKVTAVVGDHWHIPTADAQVLPKGTAHITDVGMCGSLHSSLGVQLESVIPRWEKGAKTKNQPETKGPLQFNAVLIKSDPKNGLALSIHQIQKTAK